MSGEISDKDLNYAYCPRSECQKERRCIHGTCYMPHLKRPGQFISYDEYKNAERINVTST